MPIQQRNYSLIFGVLLLILPTGFNLASAIERCIPPAGKIASFNGNVEYQGPDTNGWQPANIGTNLCFGDEVRTGTNSQAIITIDNAATYYRMTEKTNTRLNMTDAGSFLNQLINGTIYFIHRTTREFIVSTQYGSTYVEGTEFLVHVDHQAQLAETQVFEGQVRVENAFGTLQVPAGNIAISRQGQAPVIEQTITSRDSVQWTMYYPPVFDINAEQFTDLPASAQTAINESLRWYTQNHGANALRSIANITIDDSRLHLYRATLYLSVGNTTSAIEQLRKVRKNDPRYADALAINAMMAIAQNDKTTGLKLAKLASTLNPCSIPVRLALSYAYQAQLDLAAATQALENPNCAAISRNFWDYPQLAAVDTGTLSDVPNLQLDLNQVNTADRQRILLLARRSELLLMQYRLEDALQSATELANLYPNLAQPHIVLGFAQLASQRPNSARKNFQLAVQRAPDNPYARLGLGVALIRIGERQAGRLQIEQATIISPDNPLIRSYMGKAYLDEKRDPLANTQFNIAKELDPNDPTPYLYDALHWQYANAPVQALENLQKSLALNNKRQIYRVNELLVQDEATRASSLGRIYTSLGFTALGLQTGFTATARDHSSYGGHRLLADLYKQRRGSEIARVSELLQAQLWEPLAINPIQPQLTESDLTTLQGAGPSSIGFNEFNPAFSGYGVRGQINSLVGENNTNGTDAVVSFRGTNIFASCGAFYYHTDGFRPNTQQQQKLANCFAQWAINARTSVQVDAKYRETAAGDLSQRFDGFTSPATDATERSDSYRIGFRHDFNNHHKVIGFVSRQFNHEQLSDTQINGTAIAATLQQFGTTGELQYLYTQQNLSIISGLGYFENDKRQVFNGTPTFTDTYQTQAYTYAHYTPTDSLLLTLGFSYDKLNESPKDQNQTSPKFGLSWQALDNTTIRLAAFRSFKRPLLNNQTLEPTQIAGFNQLFDDDNGTDSKFYGIGFEQQFSTRLYAGLESTTRNLKVPLIHNNGTQVDFFNWEEDKHRAYLYWAALDWLSLFTEYTYEELTRPEDFAPNRTTRLLTQQISMGFNLFLPNGLSLNVSNHYVDQKGDFMFIEDNGDQPEDNSGQPEDKPPSGGRENFWVTDIELSYRLPQHFGLVAIGAKNVFNQAFRFEKPLSAGQSAGIAPPFALDRFIFGRVNLSF